MTNWKNQSIRLRLEYAVKRKDEAGVEFEPHETALEFAIAKLLVTDQLDGVGQLILGLQCIDADDPYVLFRLKDKVAFGFDTDDQLKPLWGALKVSFTNADLDTGTTIVDTICYPISFSPRRDTPVDGDELPIGIDWKLLLAREDIADDSPVSVYRLIHVKPEGGGAAPICEELECDTTTDRSTRIKCALEGCYE